MNTLLVILLSLGALLQSDTGEAPPAEPKERPPADASAETAEATLTRVIIYPSRLHAVAGHILEETESKLEIRDRQGEIKTFDPSLIFSMVRLKDIKEPVPAVVLLHDGRRREGLLKEDGFDVVRMKIHHVDHAFPRSEVALVQLLPSFDEQYQRWLDRLDRTDPDAWLQMCRWLDDQEQWVEAQSELEALLSEHDSELAYRLLRRVNAQIALEFSSSVGSDRTTVARSRDTMPELVSASDVNLIRVYEIDLENPPKLSIPRSSRKKLLERYPDSNLLPQNERDQQAFMKADPTSVVEIMFALRARDLYPEIKVLTEPEVLQTFRTGIHDSWLLNKCGSRACHGGPEEKAGRFRLHRVQPPNDRVRTSNLLVLNRLEIDGRRLLDWNNPADSLVYQYALPPTAAKTPHPPVKGYKPVFTEADSDLNRIYLDWVEAMIRRHHRDWPVEYVPWAAKAPEQDTPAGDKP
ncbi:MAG: hypothetical protein CMJ39_02525 [Phycisphaerae bacterium]|nr:hypothetical protein [Phycisphaerae bacterium]